MTKQYIGGDVYDIRFQSGLEVELSEADIAELILDFETRTIIDHTVKRDLANAISNNDKLSKNLKELIAIYNDKDQGKLMEEMDNDIRDQAFNLGELDKIIKSI